MNSDTNIEFENITNALNEATKYGLQTEVVYSALLGLKNNPEWTIEQAISYGFYEWVK